MHYSNDPAMCRVDLFKPSGKWYDTKAIRLPVYYSSSKTIHELFIEELKEQLGGNFKGFRAVCLEPHHKYAHPLMIIIDWD